MKAYRPIDIHCAACGAPAYFDSHKDLIPTARREKFSLIFSLMAVIRAEAAYHKME